MISFQAAKQKQPHLTGSSLFVLLPSYLLDFSLDVMVVTLAAVLNLEGTSHALHSFRKTGALVSEDITELPSITT